MRLDIESAVSSLPVVENDVAEVNSEITRVLKEGVAAAQNGDRPMARTLLLSVTEAEPRNVDAWLWLASISEYPEELLVFLNNALDVDPVNSRALTWKTATCSLLAKTHVQRGQTAMQELQNDYAMQCFDKAIETDQNCEMAWFWKASLLDDENEKLECLERALSLNPENEEAVAAVKDIASDRAEAKMHDIKLLATSGDHAQANEMLNSVLESEPENTEAWVLRSHLARSFEDKLHAYDRVLQFDPSNAFAQYGFNFLSELADSVKPADVVETETAYVAAKPEFVTEPLAEAQTEEFSDDSHEVAESEVAFTSVGYDETNDDSSISAEPAAPEYFEEPTSAETENTVSEQVSSFALAEEADTESEHAEYTPSEIVQEFVAPEQELTESAIEETSFYGEDESSEDEPSSPQDAQASFEPVAERNFFHESDLAEAFRDTAETIDPFHEEATPIERPIFAVEEAAQESNTYASPFAETQAFKTDSYQSEDTLDTDEPIPIHETVASPFKEKAVDYLEPWDSSVDEDISEPETEFGYAPEPMFAEAAQPTNLACPFCSAEVEPQSFSCGECRAVLTLSDVESLLANGSADRDLVQTAVTKMEAEWNSRDFSADELKMLGIGHFNLKNYDMGLAFLQEALRSDPNDVILSSQVNTLAIRRGEIRKQEQNVEALPKGKTILVVDDSATVRKLISSKLEKCGHKVLCAVDGVEAIEMIADVTPDLVLLDIAMPRMDGYQVCKEIRSRAATKDIPVVMISGRDGFFDKVRGRMAGSTDHITKPFGPETLMKTLETYLAADSGASE